MAEGRKYSVFHRVGLIDAIVKVEFTSAVEGSHGIVECLNWLREKGVGPLELDNLGYWIAPAVESPLPSPHTKLTSSCLAKAGDDEPIFVLRAQDRLAPEVVCSWAAALAAVSPLGWHDRKVRAAHAVALEMEAWAAKNGSKVPD